MPKILFFIVFMRLLNFLCVKSFYIEDFHDLIAFSMHKILYILMSFSILLHIFVPTILFILIIFMILLHIFVTKSCLYR